MKILTIYTTVQTERDANELVSELMKSKLIACANCWEIEGHFKWKGKDRREYEIACLLKTSIKKRKKVLKAIKKIHPYKLPCVIIRVEKTTDDYAYWIGQEVKAQ